MGHISGTWELFLCEYWRKSMIIGEKNTDLKRLTRATKTSLFDRNLATSLKPRRRSRPLRLVWWALNIHYHWYLNSSYWISCDTSDNVRLNLQNCCYFIFTSRSFSALLARGWTLSSPIPESPLVIGDVWPFIWLQPPSVTIKWIIFNACRICLNTQSLLCLAESQSGWRRHVWSKEIMKIIAS